MKKQLLLIMMIMLPMVASAQVFINGIYYELYDNMSAMVTGRNPIYRYSGDVIIPSKITYDGNTYTVTRIGSGAFSGSTGLTSITIPSSVTSISGATFAGCTNLTSIKVDSENKYYDSRENCNALINTATNTLISGCMASTIPNSVTAIGESAFSGISSLTSLTIPDNVTTIGNNAFKGCTNLTSVNFPKSVISIREEAFYECTSLSSITISNSETYFGNYVFGECTSLTSAKLPEVLPKQDYFNIFLDCSSLTSIKIPEGPQNIFFSGCSSLTDVYIPSSVEYISGPYKSNNLGKIVGAFLGCDKLKSIIVDSKNKYYDSRDNCNAIIDKATNTLIYGSNTTIIPSSVTAIGNSAFFGRSELSSITIPSSVNYIGDNAFNNCTSLTSIKVDSDNKYYDSRENCNAIIETTTNTLIYGCITSTIPNSVTAIGTSAFSGISKLTSFTIPENITSIANEAFKDCRLENIVTKSTHTNFDGNPFSDATFQHAMLYIPAESWLEIVYESGWYRFNNIREMATEKNDISQSRAYMLMDAETFGYAVYDDVDDEVKMVKAFYSMDEHDLNNNWQVRIQGSNSYLYNLGAKKFASIAADGRLILTADATPLTLTEGENGIIIDADGDHEWAFVKNNSINDVTAIDIPAITSSLMPDGYYSLNSQHFTKPQKGVNIIRTSDGKTQKIIKK